MSLSFTSLSPCHLWGPLLEKEGPKVGPSLQQSLFSVSPGAAIIGQCPTSMVVEQLAPAPRCTVVTLTYQSCSQWCYQNVLCTDDDRQANKKRSDTGHTASTELCSFLGFWFFYVISMKCSGCFYKCYWSFNTNIK